MLGDVDYDYQLYLVLVFTMLVYYYVKFFFKFLSCFTLWIMRITANCVSVNTWLKYCGTSNMFSSLNQKHFLATFRQVQQYTRIECRRTLGSKVAPKRSLSVMKYVGIFASCGISYAMWMTYRRNLGTVYAFKAKKVSQNLLLILNTCFQY